MGCKLLFVVTEDWYFCSHRLPLACAAKRAGFEVAVVTRETHDGDQIRSAGLRLIPVDMKRGKIGLIADVATLIALWQTFRREKPQLVHNVALKPVVLGTVAARLAAVKGIVNALAGLGYVFSSGDRRASILRVIVRFLFRVLFRDSSVRVLVQNCSDRKFIEDLGIGPERTTLIAGSGVDVSYFVPVPEPDGPVVVAMVSRMLRDKGVGEVVEAGRMLKRKGHSIVIRLVGPTDSANPSSVSELMLKDWVREGIVEWFGSTRDVRSVWANSHIGILPSYREGLPKSLLEAGACGRPVVATDVPGCRDVVIHEKTGLLVPPREPKKLVQAIIRLAEDPTLRKRLGEAARERVKAHFSVDQVVAQTLTLYKSMLATK